MFARSIRNTPWSKQTISGRAILSRYYEEERCAFDLQKSNLTPRQKKWVIRVFKTALEISTYQMNSTPFDIRKTILFELNKVHIGRGILRFWDFVKETLAKYVKQPFRRVI